MGHSDSSWTQGFRLLGGKESLNARGSQAHGLRWPNVQEQTTHSEGLGKADWSLAWGGLGKESFAGEPPPAHCWLGGKDAKRNGPDGEATGGRCWRGHPWRSGMFGVL